MISIDELPYNEFSILGLSKKDVLSFPPRTLNALLSGSRTSLIRFNQVPLGVTDNKVSLNGKLSLSRAQDGKINLRFHPVNDAPKNAFNLTKEEAEFLRKNETSFIDKKIRTEDGTVKIVKVSLDPITNEYVGINRNTIRAPEQINNTVLSEKQKEEFRDGQTITVDNKSYKLNPNSEIGISDANGNDTGLRKVRFKNSSYSSNELLLDMALLASGLGSFVMLEHLASLFVAANRTKEQNLRDPLYWRAITDASKEIRGLKEDIRYQPTNIESIVVKHLQEHGIHLDNRQEISNPVVNKVNLNGSESKVDNKPSHQQKRKL